LSVAVSELRAGNAKYRELQLRLDAKALMLQCGEIQDHHVF
jgi:hypothetical protein